MSDKGYTPDPPVQPPTPPHGGTAVVEGTVRNAGGLTASWIRDLVTELANEYAGEFGFRAAKDALERFGLELVIDLATHSQANRIAVGMCGHCGWREEFGTDTEAGDAGVKAHALTCAKHPMRTVEAERDQLRAEVKRLTECDEKAYQARVLDWMNTCFPVDGRDTATRNYRFLEEALELVQALGCGYVEAIQVVDYVYKRHRGEPAQEVGGVMVTLAALCAMNGIDMRESGEQELARVWTIMDKIRAKQASKPKGSPLPEAPTTEPVDAR